ncbi:MAG: type II secretion system F family protein [Actinomycetia bacterium]|nr:type II secretion system F family protein [Actinomycetes bacterium]
MGTIMLTVAWLLILTSLGIALGLILKPGHRLSRSRRRMMAGGRSGQRTTLTTAADYTTDAVNKVLEKRGSGLAVLVDMAGIKTSVTDLVVVVAAAALAAGALGVVLANPAVGLVAAALVVVGFRVALSIMISRQKKAFAGQLDSTLQMMASSLRAGYSLLQAVQAMGNEADSPTKEEFARVINETRIGRPLNDSLTEVATRMDSEDFTWVAQAIAINREVGGNLADVLDGVAKTIRDRSQLQRQVAALASEGKLSAIILMALPFGITIFLSFANPGYLNQLFTTPIGWGITGAAVVMLIIGGIWLRATVKIKF